MGIDVQQPWLLLLLLPAIYVVVHWWRGQKQMPVSRKSVIAAIRTAVFCLLILALAGIQLLYPVRAETVVFVYDSSASIKDEQPFLRFLRDAVAGKQKEDQYGVVAAAANAAVDQPLTMNGQVQGVSVEVNRHATNLAEGIRLAQAMIPSNARGKIVLVTDGLPNQGDTAREIKLATERGIAVESVLFEQPQGDEVVLSSVQVPDQLYTGEEYTIKVDVESTVATRATLRLYEGNREVGTQTVQVEKGKNRYLFSEKAMNEGFHRYRVEIEAVRDTVQANNQAFAYTQVTGTPSVLVVEGHPGAAKNLVNALQAGHIRVENKDVALLPKELEGYKQFASIVLADLSATEMSEADMERIRTAVRDLGVGLIMTGGPDGFGMGGWFQTPIEEALPVHMDLRSKEELPTLGLILVIDKSGSMSGDSYGLDKMELAKEAAIRATAMLNRQDEIGVIAFDGTPWEVVPPQNVSDVKAIQGQIGSIFADGGTDIFPALQMAAERIKTMKTKRKHVILLTDGQSGREDNYQGLLEQMIGENVTVSTVAVGDDSDTELLEDIAKWGKGRYYFATDGASIPQIFSKETALASRTFIVEKPQVPEWTGTGDWTGLRQPLPMLRAYVATTIKQTAEPLLMSQDADPILSRWQYGLGRAVAWTSDLEGKWAPDWIAWPGNSRLWTDIIGWTLPQISPGRWQVETKLDGSEGKVSVSLPKGEKLPQELEAVVVNREMKREVVRLKPVAPGMLEGRFSASEPGSYLIQVTEKANGQIIAGQTAGLSVSYSPEFGLPQDGAAQMEEWLAAGGGTKIADAKEVFTGKLPAKWETQPIGEWLLMLAACLWPLDVAARRLQLPEQWWARLSGLLRRRKTGAVGTEKTERAEVFARLGEKRDQRFQHDPQARPGESDGQSVQSRPQAERSGQALPQSKGQGKRGAQAVRPSKDEGEHGAQAVPQGKTQADQRKAAASPTGKTGASHQTGSTSGDGQQDETINRLLAAKKRKQR
ncbi:VWA domain-containing protein [Brevibacillus ruminantium]|uniref:VWA domain-containing protein n=1 Tax=Brevibacillus ruminantium TaxID=2950604 RepID=A0ABY4WCZ7_9BACL|nr:VWA domain-containing protein [Brevibacillus ruminantium]USG64938.1 VWA domain-containing protein [Brevibacillus ruminantium]